MMGNKFLAFVAVGAALAAGCTQPSEPPPPAPAAAPPPPARAEGQVIVAKRGGFIPEGVEYDIANGRFLTGSLVEGTIFQFERDGSIVPFITDPELKSSVGIEADEPRDRLLVCNSDRAVFDPGNVGQAKLGVYSLTTGERIAMVDLAAVIGTPSDPPAYFANDVTVDGDGNAYVTDTRMNVVYKVTPDYQASVLHRFTGLPEGVAVNGIVYDDGGYLLVVANEHIYKVPVGNPDATTEVKVSEPVPGQDGAVWSANGHLAVVSNIADAPRVVELVSNDDWATAQRAAVATLMGQATTAAAVGSEIWAVHPHFNDADPPSLEQAVFK
jgi:sugar lactone lactonase YvrE